MHQASGAAALAYSIYLGRRKGWGTERLAFRPNNIANIVMGTSLLWFGWTGFNAGSELAGNLRAVQAAFNTNGAAASGGITWMLMDWRYDRQFSTVSLCSGVLAGLIAVTPAAGFVCTMAAIAIGVVASVCCNMATRLKFVFKYDDALDIFSTHGIGGLVGTILTGVFADADIIAYDGTVSKGGWVNQHWMQVPYQLADAAATLAWSFTITLLLCFIIDHIPGCKLRVRDEVEEYGVDEEQLGEVMYRCVASCWVVFTALIPCTALCLRSQQHRRYPNVRTRRLLSRSLRRSRAWTGIRRMSAPSRWHWTRQDLYDGRSGSSSEVDTPCNDVFPGTEEHLMTEDELQHGTVCGSLDCSGRLATARVAQPSRECGRVG